MPRKQQAHYVLCLNNTGYGPALEIRKLYRSIPDPTAQAKGFIRIIDESGEDYLYPASRFSRIMLPAATKRALAKAS